jgi:hypothetical protein
MPTPASSGTNQFHCEFCGRDFNTETEFRDHQTECAAAKATGSGDRTVRTPDKRDEPDREWFSTP